MATNSSTSSSRKAYGLTILKSSHAEIRRLKREGHEPELHGNKFWNSSYLIMEYLKKHPLKKKSRVLEIGCGWGLLGIHCAKKFDAKVSGIDLDENVGPYLDLHAEINGVKMTFEKRSFQQMTLERLKKFDIIFGSDICYWDEMTPVLFNLIKRAKKAGVKQVMIADPCRPPFNDLSERCQNYFDNVEVVEKWIGKPVKASGEILIVNHQAGK